MRPDEVHFGLHHGEVVLRSSLQHEGRTQPRKVRYLGDVEPDVLGQHGRESRQDLRRSPPAPLEIDDVRLEEHGAAVTEVRHRVRGERHISIVVHLHAKRPRGALQEIAVPRRALCVEPEVLDLSVLQDDDLDVLATHVADDVGVRVEVEGRPGVRDGFHDCHVGAEHVPEDVLRIAGDAEAEDVERGALVFHRRAAGAR